MSIKKISNQLATLCVTLNEFPYIRYNSKQLIAKEIAAQVQRKLEYISKVVPNFAPADASDRAVLLILDRSVDNLAPILHEFTYQAMSYDLLPIQDDKYNYEFKNNANEVKEKQVLLSESDILWPQLRHMHIQDTIETVLTQFNAFIASNKAVKSLTKGDINSISEMSDALRAMPQYQEQLNKYSLHIQLTGECMKIFKDQNLEKLATCEQDMAMGCDSDGRPVKNLFNDLVSLLTDTRTTKENKIRLLMTYIISQSGVKDDDRKRLMEAANIPVETQNTISNLFYVGVTLSKGSSSAQKEPKSKKKN